MPQGNYFSLLYETTEEFMSVVAAFLDAGLKENECCIWAVSGQITRESAEKFLRDEGIDVDSYLRSGQLIIIPCTECYIADEGPVSERTLRKWQEIHDTAISDGFSGLRIADKFTIVGEDSWKRFVEFEKKGIDIIRRKNIIALFAFLLEARTRSEILDIIEMHDGTVVKQKGIWTLLQSSSTCKPLVSEKRFPENILEDIWTGVWAVDRYDRIVYFNKGMEAISGFSKDDVLGQKLDKFVPRQVNQEELSFIELFNLAKENLRSKSYDIFPFIKPDGQYVYHSGVLLPLTDENGSYAGMIGTVGKTSQQEISHKKLRDQFKSIERLEEIYKRSPVVAVLWRAEKDWPIEFISENIAQFGYIPENFTSGELTYADIVHPDDLDIVKTSAEQLEIERKFYYSKDYRLLTKSGEPRWVTERSYLIRDENGEPAYYQGIIIDVTERKRAEEKLVKSEALLTEVSRIAKIGGWEFDASTGKGTWTPEIARIHELDSSTPTDVEFGLSFYPPGSRELIEKAVHDAVEKGEPYDIELELITAKGTHKWVRTIGNPVIKNGKVVSVTGALQDITERKKAEEAALENEKKYRLIFENSPLGIFHFNEKGILTHCNEKFLEIMGLKKKEDIIGFNLVASIVDEQMKKAVKDVFSRKIGHFEGEYHTVSTDITVNIKADYSPNIADDGTFFGGIGVFEDISERKKAEIAALEAEKKFRLIFENSPLGIFNFNQNGMVTHCNEKFLQIIGLEDKEDIIGFNMVTQIKDPKMKKAINDVLSRNAGHFEGEYHTVISGKEVFIKADYSPNIAHNGTFLGGIGIFADISARKKAEEALRLDESRLETLLRLNQMTDKTFKEIADFVQEEAVKLTQSKMGYLAFLNEEGTVLSIYSWSKNVMSDCNVEQEKKFDYLLESTGLWGEPVRQKHPIIVNDYEASNKFKSGYPKGHVKMKRYMSVPIIEGGKVVGVAGVGNKEDPYDQADVRQLTLLMEGMWQMMEQKRAEDTLRKFASKLAQVNRDLSKANAELSQANEELKSLDLMKDEFLSNVSHEFKTPLTSIQGYSQLIWDGTLGPVNEQQKKAVDTVIRNSERLRKLVDSLLYISRAQAGKLSYSFDDLMISDVIDNSIQDLSLQAEKKDIEINKYVAEDLPPIRGDKDKLTDVMINLIDNAIKFTPQGGRIDLGVEVDDNSLHIYVRDTGIGIPEDKISNLFQRFYQVDASVKRRYGGTGLGLYICKKIVEDHEGSIWVKSKEGEGSTFHILLPLKNSDSSDSKE